MRGHVLIVLAVIRRLDLLDEEIYQVEQVYIVQLLRFISFLVKINIDIGLLQNELN